MKQRDQQRCQAVALVAAATRPQQRRVWLIQPNRHRFSGALACAAIAWLLLNSGISAVAEDPAHPAQQDALESATAPDGHNAPTGVLPVLILQLDSERFNERNDATRQIVEFGPKSVPLLVESLSADSREIRFRVSEILRHCFTFDQIAQHLIDAVGQPFGSEARLILRDRALWQVADVAQMENTTRLFEFWGTSVEALRRRVTFELLEARGREQVAAVVAPLIGLQEKAQVFNANLLSLQALSLTFQHGHSPGFVIAETLAQGLLENDQSKIKFAHDYIGAFNLLASRLQEDGRSSSDVRKEVNDRASMSDGATCFLARVLNGESKERQFMIDRLKVDPETLKSEFIRGIALLEARECYRCVGKVHIADMLLESLDQWPGAPTDGVVQSVVDCVVATIATGDKKKALALLDAIEGCAELESAGLVVREGIGLRLAKRICLAALVASDNRECFPVRAIHDRILKILNAGVPADSDLFPREFVERYLEGDNEATSDQSRLAIGRFVNVVELLKQNELDDEQPGVRRILRLMSRHVGHNSPLLGEAAAEVTRQVQDAKKLSSQQLSSQQRRDVIDRALDTWAGEHEG